jgi:hypothetical protein
MASGQASNQTGDKGQKAIEISDMSTCLNYFPHNLKLCSHYVQKKQNKQGTQIESDIKMSHFHYAASNQ